MSFDLDAFGKSKLGIGKDVVLNLGGEAKQFLFTYVNSITSGILRNTEP